MAQRALSTAHHRHAGELSVCLRAIENSDLQVLSIIDNYRVVQRLPGIGRFDLAYSDYQSYGLATFVGGGAVHFPTSATVLPAFDTTIGDGIDSDCDRRD